MKNNILFLAIIVFSGIVAAIPEAEERRVIGFKEIAERAEKNSFASAAAVLSAGLAREAYNQILSSGRPSITLTSEPFSNPLYGYSKTSLSDYGLPGVAESHSFGTGLSLNQLLPTGGTVSLGLSEAIGLKRIDDGNWIVSQDPALSFSVFQPFLVDGKFLDGGIMKSGRRIGEIAYEQAGLAAEEAANQAVLSALTGAFQILLQRKNVSHLEREAALGESKLAVARIERDSGRISEADLLTAELEKARLNEAVFDAEYQLFVAERSFAAALGLAEGDTYDIILDMPDLKSLVYDAYAVRGKAVEENPAVRRGLLAVEETKHSYKANRAEEAPIADLYLDLGPRYPDNRTAPTTFAGSFSDFFADGAGIDINAGLSIEISLYAGGREKHRKNADGIAAELSRKNLDNLRRNLTDTAVSLLSKAGLLDEKMKLLQASIDYDKKLLEREIQRRAFGASMETDVETVRLKVSGLELRMEQTKAEQDLLLLNLLVMAGKNVKSLTEGY